jgi:hypothetical protein
MAVRRQNIPDDVSKLYLKHHEKRTKATVEEYTDLLRSVTKQFSTVYVIIDALDECVDENGKPIWVQLVRTLKNSVSKLHLLYSSRQIEDIACVLVGSTRIEVEASDDDIRSYVRAEVKSRDYLVDFCMQDVELQEKIIEAVPSASQRT